MPALIEEIFKRSNTPIIWSLNGIEYWKYAMEVKPQDKKGIFTDTLKIHTDYKNLTVVAVQIRGRITGDVVVIPEQLFIGSIKKGLTHVGTLQVVNAGKEPLEITSIKTEPEYLAGDYKVLEPGKRYKVTITVTPDAPIGNLKGRITIYTNNHEEPSVTVPAIAIIRGDTKQ